MTTEKSNVPSPQKPVLEIDIAGNKRWTVDGVLHREDGPAVEKADGRKAWYFEGQRHRDNGPALVRADGTKEWYFHGERHREEGPAIEYPDGTKEWWLRDRHYTKFTWLREVLKKNPLTAHQRELLYAFSENWDGTPALLCEIVTHLT